jgi:hypothetical protein
LSLCDFAVKPSALKVYLIAENAKIAEKIRKTANNARR